LIRGADLSKVCERDHLILSGADIEGTFFEEGHVPDRRAINFNSISRTQNQLTFFWRRDPSAPSVSNPAKLHDQAVIGRRQHDDSTNTQQEYDKRFGLALRR
jgi:hypothetical protein